MILFLALLMFHFVINGMEERKPLESFNVGNISVPTLHRDYRDEIRAAIMRLDRETLWHLVHDNAIPGQESYFFNFNYNDNGQSPLEVALHTGDIGMLQELVNLGATHIPNSITGLFPIHVATLNGFEELVGALIRAFPESVFSRDRFGNTPLHIAAHLTGTKIAKLLLKSQSNPGFVNNDQQTPLMLARQFGNRELAWLIDDVQEEKFGPFEHLVEAVHHMSLLPPGYWRVSYITNKKTLKESCTTNQRYELEDEPILISAVTAQITQTSKGYYIKGWKLERPQG